MSKEIIDKTCYADIVNLKIRYGIFGERYTLGQNQQDSLSGHTENKSM